MTRAEILGGALSAAHAQGYFPDTVAATPDIRDGRRASTVLLANQFGSWIVCVHNHDASKGDWYVTGDLPEGSARMALADYAENGV